MLPGQWLDGRGIAYRATIEIQSTEEATSGDAYQRLSAVDSSISFSFSWKPPSLRGRRISTLEGCTEMRDQKEAAPASMDLKRVPFFRSTGVLGGEARGAGWRTTRRAGMASTWATGFEQPVLTRSGCGAFGCPSPSLGHPRQHLAPSTRPDQQWH